MIIIPKPKIAGLAASPSPSRALPPRRLLRIAVGAARLGCSVTTLRRRAKDGSIPHYRLHGRLMFDEQDLDAHLEAHRVLPDWENEE
jgi:excisionase family DNA binding protein